LRRLNGPLPQRPVLDRIIKRMQGDEELLRDIFSAGPERERRLRSEAIKIMCDEGMVCTGDEIQGIVSLLLEEMLGLGSIEPLLKDERVSEIMINGTGQSYVEREGVLQRTSLGFRDEDQIFHLIDRIVGPLGLRVDESAPYVDARLPDGSRVNIIIPPLSLRGPVITIRKFSRSPLTMEKLVVQGQLTSELREFLATAVRRRLNILISGGTGSGKTTLLNALSAHIPEGERIITIEDAAELQLQQEHVIPLEARPPNLEGKGEVTLRDLLRNALRMRPDRIIIGEVRGSEALDMLQAMNTGHEGSLSTVHANSPHESLYRLETMASMAGSGLSPRSISAQIRSSVDLVVHLARSADGNRRIVEVSYVEEATSGGSYSLRQLFLLGRDGSGGRFAQQRMVDLPDLARILSRRSIDRHPPQGGH
jgi:pilus assembly protein CpaF